MRDMFPGYVIPTEAEIIEAFKDAIISFDANILLDLHRLNHDMADKFVKTLKDLKGRLWLTHQAALEFMRNRLNVIQDQANIYDDLKTEFDKMVSPFQGKIRRHSPFPLEKYQKRFEEISKEIEKDVAELKAKHIDQTHNHAVFDAIDEIFKGQIGSKFTEEEHKKLIEDCKIRFEKEIPPGFKDAKKPEDRKYGDAIMWLQLIAYAIEKKKTVIFVLEDNKEDWWEKDKGRNRPRPELIEEMHQRAGVRCFIFKTEAFLTYASKFLKQNEPKELIDEVRAVGKQKAVLETEKRHSREEEFAWENRTLEKIASLKTQIESLRQSLDYWVAESAQAFPRMSEAKDAFMRDSTSAAADVLRNWEEKAVYAKSQIAVTESELRRTMNKEHRLRRELEAAAGMRLQRSLMSDKEKVMLRASEVEAAMRREESEAETAKAWALIKATEEGTVAKTNVNGVAISEAGF
ncbi:PIN-like domain-containing protein [Zavarzinella formosa]|uniref:PIN-like domain-containing protein n=1 Tax=Zavarzinella formosa TaxID=360055 RepID=UPI0002FBF619|nr:PIN domain-containing protein [Zavarzinella formosa]